MNKFSTEYASKFLLQVLALEERAKAILRKKDSRLPYYAVSVIGSGICNFLVNSSGFDAPLVIRVLIVSALIFGTLSILDNYMLRRKLEAAVDLLLIQEKRRENGENI